MAKLMVCGLQVAATPDQEVLADSCTSTLTPTSDDVTNCALTATADFGVTQGSCADVDSGAISYQCHSIPSVLLHFTSLLLYFTLCFFVVQASRRVSTSPVRITVRASRISRTFRIVARPRQCRRPRPPILPSAP